MGTSCLATIQKGFSTNMNLFSKVFVIFLAVRNASAIFRHMYHYRRWNRLCHGDSSSLMWLSITWWYLMWIFGIAAVTWGWMIFPAWCDLSTVFVSATVAFIEWRYKLPGSFSSPSMEQSRKTYSIVQLSSLLQDTEGTPPENLQLLGYDSKTMLVHHHMVYCCCMW